MCEPPNNKLHKFIGTMFFGAEGLPLSNDELLLRVCCFDNLSMKKKQEERKEEEEEEEEEEKKNKSKKGRHA